MMMGFALQQGLLPVTLEAIEQAIELNGVSVANNLQALALGRYLAHYGAPETSTDMVNISALESVEDCLHRELDKLVAYQGQALASNFKQQVTSWQAQLEERLTKANCDSLLKPMLNQYSRLLRNKDEYEVARLFSQPEWQSQLADSFDGDTQIKLNLSPLGISGWNKWLQQPKKYAMGAWLLKLMPVLASMRKLRGGVFDIYARHPERQAEAEFTAFYVAQMQQLCERVDDSNYAAWKDLVMLFDQVHGYGPIRQHAMTKTRDEVSKLISSLEKLDLAKPA